MESYIDGIRYIIVKPIIKQNRKHKTKRINKKYKKRYGFTVIDPTKGQALVMGNTVFLSSKMYEIVKQSKEVAK
jgi:hypothetical protein